MMIAEVLDLTYSAYLKALERTEETPKNALDDALIKITGELDEHPEEYEGPGSCRLCCSYA